MTKIVVVLEVSYVSVVSLLFVFHGLFPSQGLGDLAGMSFYASISVSVYLSLFSHFSHTFLSMSLSLSLSLSEGR